MASPTLSSKNNRTFLKNKQKNKSVCIHTINRNENEDKHETWLRSVSVYDA